MSDDSITAELNSPDATLIGESDQLLPPPETPTSEDLAQQFFGQAQPMPTAENLFEEPLRQRALGVLEEEGFLRREDEHIVCDLDRFTDKSNRITDLLGDMGPIATSKEYGGRTVIGALFHIFRDTEVISETDWHDGIRDSKPLFYIPQTSETALDPAQMNKQDFYIGLWETSGYLAETYPTQREGFQSHVSSWETTVNALIYHPRFGNGQREANGKLYVTYPDGERKIVSKDYFEERDYYGAPGATHIPVHRAREFMETRCKKLFELGLIRPSDFPVISGSSLAERYRVREKLIGKNGQFMIDKKRYFVGREPFGDGNHAVTQLSQEYAVIVQTSQEKQEIVSVIQLASPDTPSGYVGKDKWRMYGVEEFVEKVPQAMEVIQEHQEFLSFSEQVSRGFGINLARFSVREQAMATQAYREHGNAREFWDFIATHGENGLKAFMLAESELANANMIVSIGNNPRYAIMFEDVAGIVHTVGKYEQLMHRLDAQFADDERFQITQLSQSALRLAGKQLVAIGEISKQPDMYKQLGISESDIVSTLHILRQQIEQTYDQYFCIDQKGIDLTKIFAEVSEPANADMLQSAANSYLEALWAKAVDQYVSARDDKGVLRALDQMVLMYESHPQLLKHVDEFVVKGNQRLLYRVLARGEVAEEKELQAIGKVLRHSNIAREINTLRAMLQDESIPEAERAELEKMTARVLGLSEKAVHPELNALYDAHDYSETHANKDTQALVLRVFSQIAKKYGLEKSMRLLDLGSGVNWFADALKRNGFAHAEGLEFSPAQIALARRHHPDTVIHQGSWRDLQEFQGKVDMLTNWNHGYAHDEYEAQFRASLQEASATLLPGGYIAFSMPNPEKEGGYYNTKLREYRKVLQEFGYSEDEANQQWMIVDSPDGENYYNRLTPPERQIRTELEHADFEVLEVMKVNIPHMPDDERLVYIARKR